ncbi:aromatic acid exporter family protein, partial [Kitasatospora cineracea]|uniref:FUSC family protein n=1 Tax=Kitasatospora cineracea TaxID=88074 RepID=UPI0034046E27
LHRLARPDARPAVTAPDPAAPWRRRAEEAWRAVGRALRHPVRAVRSHRESVVQTARVAVACALAWEAAVLLLGEDEQPVLAPLAALLTVQLTVLRTLAQGLRQIGGVMLGAVAALGLLRLGEQATEVPVTVLLVLSTGAPYAPVRIWDTLLGVASGVLVNLVAAPPTYVSHAAHRTARVAHRLADIAHDTARGLREGWDERDSDSWLRRVEAAARELDLARETAGQAEEGIRLNPRRLRQRTDPAAALGPLGEGLTCLGHVCDQLGSVLRGLDDLARGERQFPYEADARERLRPLGGVLEAVGDALDLLGRIQRDHVREPGHTDDLTAVLERGRDHHAAAAETLCHADHGPAVRSLHGSIMDETQQILHELDPSHGPHPTALHPRPLRLAAPPEESPSPTR